MKALRPLPFVPPLLTLFLIACGEDEPILPVNSAPSAPVYVEPANGAGGQSTVIDLRWQPSVDPDDDPVTYEVFFGTAPGPPLIDAHRVSTWFTPPALLNSTTYYWKVIARDDHGHTSSGQVWSFTTAGIPPFPPTLLSPQNAAVGLATAPTFSWAADSHATAYAVQVSTVRGFTTTVFADSGLTGTTRQVVGLDSATTYYWRVQAINAYGTSAWSAPWFFSTAVACPASVEYGGTTYSTVVIGGQCWFRENLALGTAIPGTTNQTNNFIVEKYCYEDDPDFCSYYGGLYQWNELMVFVPADLPRGLCPLGWHVPSVQECETLLEVVDSDGNALKASGQGTGGGAGTNTSGFAALLAGYRFENGGFGDAAARGGFWTSTETGASSAYGLHLFATHGSVYLLSSGRSAGLSVRCLKD